MEFVFFLMLVTIIALLLSIRNSTQEKLIALQNKLDAFTLKFEKLSRQAEPKKDEGQQPTVVTPPIIPQKEAPPKTEPVKSPVFEKKESVISYPTVITGPEPPPTRKKEAARRPGFFERNPDLEKFIGENLANKIGIGVLVLGIGFFVKYAIDQNWINVYGRVLIGILCGASLLGLAHRLRKNFIAFSSVLVGGGIAVLYLTITIAFQEYEIIGQTSAFLIMVLITGFTVLLSLYYNRMELAILAILGGFGSPFMVSTGEGNYIVLFSYILLLDVGMIVLAYFKKWNPVNVIAYAFTIILFGSWLTLQFNAENKSMVGGAIIFATMFYIVFFVMNILNNVKERTKFNSLEISLLLSNTFLYYIAGMLILAEGQLQLFKGLFTACIGVFNFVFAYILFKNLKVDRNLVFVLIGLVLTFISLAAPIQLEGNYITLFWAAETVLLLWLSQQSGIRLMKLASIIIMMLMWISLIMDWINVYHSMDGGALNIVLNKGFITGIVAIASIILYYRLLNNERSEYVRYVPLAQTVLTFVSVVFVYAAFLLELRHHLNIHVPDGSSRLIITGTFNMLFILAMVAFEKKVVKSHLVQTAFPLLSIAAMLGYLFVYHSATLSVRNSFLNNETNSLGFGFHYLLVILLLVIAAWGVQRIRALKEFNQRTFYIYSWVFVFFFVFIASAELDHTVLLTLYTDKSSLSYILEQNHKIGYPILWGTASFIIITVGLKRKQKNLRVISLTLFLVTLIKLFLIDIRGISEGGKIAAFISLGVLLLIVSFMYQRLKRLLLNDEVSSHQKTD